MTGPVQLAVLHWMKLERKGLVDSFRPDSGECHRIRLIEPKE